MTRPRNAAARELLIDAYMRGWTDGAGGVPLSTGETTPHESAAYDRGHAAGDAARSSANVAAIGVYR